MEVIRSVQELVERILTINLSHDSHVLYQWSDSGHTSGHARNQGGQVFEKV